MEKYSSYKDSGVQWLGEIPSHWNLSRLKQFVSIKKGIKPNLLTFDQIDYPYLSMNYLRSREGKEIEYPTNNKGLFFVNEDKTIVLWDGANAGEFIKSKKGYLGSTMAILQPNRQIYQEQYFFYLMKSIEPTSKDYANGTTIPHFNPSIILDYNYPIPPIYEQQSMASYLDKATAEIDKAIAQQQHMIDLLNERKQIIIQRSVTKGLDENVEMKDSGIDWIGEIPVHWDTRAIKSVTQMILGKMLSSQGNNFAQSSPYICAKDVHFGSIDITDLKRMYFTNLEKERYAVREGDLLIVEGGAGAGGCAVMEKMQETIYMQNSIIAIRPKKDICNSYISYIIESYVKRGYIEYVCNKATIPHFTKEKVGATYIPIPPLEEQKHIVFHLNEVIKKINDAICRHRQMIDLLRERKQIIISEVVTGKIKVS